MFKETKYTPNIQIKKNSYIFFLIKKKVYILNIF